MNQNEHVFAICCRPEVAGNVISGLSVKTIDGYSLVNLEIASFNGLGDILKKHCVTEEAEAEIDDSIKRKRFRVSLNKSPLLSLMRELN